MENKKGSLITLVVIIGVVLIGLVLWWSQNSLLPSRQSSEVSTDDSVSSIQNDVDSIDIGDTTENLQVIDSEIDTL